MFYNGTHTGSDLVASLGAAGMLVVLLGMCACAAKGYLCPSKNKHAFVNTAASLSSETALLGNTVLSVVTEKKP